MAKQEKALITISNDPDIATELYAWEKQPGEPDLWFDRFTQYRLLGPRRSMVKVYRMSRVREQKEYKDVEGAPAYWNKHAKEWHWKERALAWDQHTLEEVAEQAEAVYNEGLALIHTRVDHLKQLGTKIERYLLHPKTTRLSPHLIEQYRGILDDIAKEQGQRVKETRLTGPGGGPVAITTSWGRGGSATNAWTEAVKVTEVHEEQPSSDA
jgi:hypothetical protein